MTKRDLAPRIGHAVKRDAELGVDAAEPTRIYQAPPVIKHRAGTLAEVAAITPQHPADLLSAAWRTQSKRCDKCGR